MKNKFTFTYIKQKINEEIQYFSLSLEEQAIFLEKHNRLRLARKKYLQLHNLPKVIQLSKQLNDYKSVFLYQVQNNEFDQAIQTAELYQLYELGAPFCEKQGHIIKAAHMYAHFDLLKAASLYKQERLWIKALDCYVKLKQYYRALDCIEQISDENIKEKAYVIIEEITDKLYQNEDYDQALKLYVRLELWNKALGAAKQLQNLEIQKLIYEKLANRALEENKIESAAHFYEYINISKAIQLYIQINNITRAAELLETIGKVEEAIHLFIKYNTPEQAYEFAAKHHMLRNMLPYYKDNRDIIKLKQIYEELNAYEEGARYFMDLHQLEIAAEFAKKLEDTTIAAQLLETMEYYESAAHHYLLAGKEESCKKCLKKAGFTPAAVENYFLVKNYKDS